MNLASLLLLPASRRQVTAGWPAARAECTVSSGGMFSASRILPRFRMVVTAQPIRQLASPKAWALSRMF
jgi:hypothetical protein